MLPLALAAHTPTPKQAHTVVDHCAPCRLFWFDAFESVQLAPRGWLQLLRVMQATQVEPTALAATPSLACPTCAVPLKSVSNQTRFGRYVALECPQRHGHLHSHAGVLAERGLVRPLLGPERKALREERHRIACFNCGAPADGSGDTCGYCRSPLVVLDLPRLAHSLKPRTVDQGAAPALVGRSMAWACRACGAALDPARDHACPQCGHLVVASELPDITALLDAAEAELDAAPRAGALLSAPARRGEAAREISALLGHSGQRAPPGQGTGLATARRSQGGPHPVLLARMLRGHLPLWLALLLALLASWWL
jgi:hypothetical protein